MYNKFEKFGLEGYPPEVRGRFNSFITTQFDDSLSVEMQLRSIIKWATGNFDETVNQTNNFIDFLNDLIEYMNEFIDTFDTKFQDEILLNLQKWNDDGTLETLINESLDTKYHEMDERLSTQLDHKANNSQLVDFQNQVDNIIVDTGTPEGIGSELSQLRSDTFGNNFKTVKQRVDNHDYLYKNGQSNIETDWVQGSLLSDGGVSNSQTTLIVTEDFLPNISNVLNIELDEKYRFAVSFYDESKDFMERTPWLRGGFSLALKGSFYKISFGNFDEVPFTPDDSNKIKLTIPFNVYEKTNGLTDKLLNVTKNKVDITKPVFVHGALLQNDGTANFLREFYHSRDYYYIEPNKTIELSVKTGREARVHFFDNETPIETTEWNTGTFRVTTQGTRFKVVVKDNTGELPIRLDSVRVYQVESTEGNATSTGSVLQGKKLFNFGDSIASASTPDVQGYQHQLSNTYDMSLTSFAQGGATVTETDRGDNNIVQQVNQAIESGITPDFVLFNGLTNDANVLDESDFGVITEGYDGELDTTTFAGAFEWLVKTMRNQWKQAKILYVRPHNMWSRDVRQVQLGDLAIEMCEKWAIPYVDLYRHSGFVIQNQEFVDLYCIPNDSGSHPNTLGYETFYVPQIKNKLENI